MDHYSVAFLWVVITNGPSVYSFVVATLKVTTPNSQ